MKIYSWKEQSGWSLSISLHEQTAIYLPILPLLNTRLFPVWLSSLLKFIPRFLRHLVETHVAVLFPQPLKCNLLSPRNKLWKTNSSHKEYFLSSDFAWLIKLYDCPQPKKRETSKERVIISALLFTMWWVGVSYTFFSLASDQVAGEFVARSGWWALPWVPFYNLKFSSGVAVCVLMC